MATPCVPPIGLIWTRSPPIVGKLISNPKQPHPLPTLLDRWLNQGGWWCHRSAAGLTDVIPSRSQAASQLDQCELVALLLVGQLSSSPKPGLDRFAEFLPTFTFMVCLVCWPVSVWIHARCVVCATSIGNCGIGFDTARWMVRNGSWPTAWLKGAPPART